MTKDYSEVDYGSDEWYVVVAYPAITDSTYRMEGFYHYSVGEWYEPTGPCGFAQYFGDEALDDSYDQLEVNYDPYIGSVNPSGGSRGTSNESMTIEGIYFGEDATVSVSGSGVSVDVLEVDYTGTVLDCEFTIEPGAQTGERTLKVTVNGRDSNGVSFTVY